MALIISKNKPTFIWLEKGSLMTLQKNSVNKELQELDKRLVKLAEEQETLMARREVILEQYSKEINNSQKRSEQLSVKQKVELFKKLFKGRQDIFARRWENSKGRSGYSFACHNEWVSGKCNKPRIKCNECHHRNYKALDDKIIYDHLAGKQIIGLYPLLADNTCSLLAADFDKDDWQYAIQAMAEACIQLNIPYAIEISRSGNGAHLWIFFSEQVFARDARLLGFGLLDKAMEIHPDLSFDSYDRLFPNQDIMPEGGFGNLIALPLQYQARQMGYSQFVDHDLIPYPDQWQFLSQVKALLPKQLEERLTKLTPNILRDTRQPPIDVRPLWEQGAKIKSIKIDDCPKQMTLTLSNHNYFKLDEIPSPLAARLKRLASFSNPVFFKTQALRFSTHGIPRYITCARIEQGYLSIPRGCLDEALELLKEQDITTVIDDKRETGRKLKSLIFIGTLRKDQSKAVNIIAKHNTGVLHAPTAFGKTVVAIGLINKRKVNTLILTHSRQLLEQWQIRLKLFLSNTEVGVIGGGKKKPKGEIDVATYQSLINKKDNTVDQLIQNYGQVIIDECHHFRKSNIFLSLKKLQKKPCDQNVT